VKKKSVDIISNRPTTKNVDTTNDVEFVWVRI
jgi:hypothetical protein